MKIILSNPDVTLIKNVEWGNNLPPKLSCDEFVDPQVAQKKKSVHLQRQDSMRQERNPNANKVEAKDDAGVYWVDDVVDDVDDRVEMDMKERREVKEGATKSGSVHIKKRIKLHHQIGFEYLTHSRVYSCQIQDSLASILHTQFMSTLNYQQHRCMKQIDTAKLGLLLNPVKENEKYFEINCTGGLKMRQEEFIFLKD